MLGQLRFLRAALLAKLDGLSEEQLTSSRLPSGWSPLELLNHLVHVERRWIIWGFLGEEVASPWADADDDGRWRLPDHDGSIRTLLEALAAQLDELARRTEQIADEAFLETAARPGGRFDAGEEPTLGWILLHLIQEYGRHVGHLDVVRELIDGGVGE